MQKIKHTTKQMNKTLDKITHTLRIEEFDVRNCLMASCVSLLIGFLVFRVLLFIFARF